MSRGYDPRECVLMAFGGAGPMHATTVADELGIDRVLVPKFPGNFSAWGLLTSEIRHDFSETLLLGCAADSIDRGRRVALAFSGSRARERLHEDGFGDDAITYRETLDMRYLGQAFEIPIPVPAPPLSADAVLAEFHRTYAKLYGHASEDQPVEIVNARLAGIVPGAGARAGGGSRGAGRERERRERERRGRVTAAVEAPVGSSSGGGSGSTRGSTTSRSMTAGTSRSTCRSTAPPSSRRRGRPRWSSPAGVAGETSVIPCISFAGRRHRERARERAKHPLIRHRGGGRIARRARRPRPSAPSARREAARKNAGSGHCNPTMNFRKRSPTSS